MVVVECSVPDCTFTTDDVSEALAIALLSNHNLAHCNLAPTVADAAPAPTAPRSSLSESKIVSSGAPTGSSLHSVTVQNAAKVPVTNICRGPQLNEEQVFEVQTQLQKLRISPDQAPVPVDSEKSSDGVMVTGRENRVAVGTEQQILRENEALKVWLEEQQEIIEEMERELLKKDDELSELNLRLTGKIMRSNRIIEELKKVNAEMARRTGDREMDVDMLPVSPESTPEGPGTTGNQEDVMATENTGLRTPLETNSCKDSAVQTSRENEALKALLKEQQEIIEEKERELLKKDDELSELNLRLTGKIMRSNRIIEELKKVNAEMARRTGDREMDVDMLPVSPESTPEGPGTTGNQEDVMATENTGLRTPLETNSCKDSAVQQSKEMVMRKRKEPQENDEENDDVPKQSEEMVMKKRKVPQEFDEENDDVLKRMGKKSYTKTRKCDPVTHFLCVKKSSINDVMVEIGPFELTVGDLWTLVPPHVAEQHSSETSSINGFVKGWLLDKVVIAVLWILTQQYDGVSGAYYNLAETDDEGRPNARLQLLGESFSNITRIFVPFIVLKSHWNLLVLDKTTKTRYYFDPSARNVPREISPSTNPSLASLIDEISKAADTKTGWRSRKWRCIELMHFQQNDDHNCGPLICYFAMCLCEGTSLVAKFDGEAERARMMEMLFRFC